MEHDKLSLHEAMEVHEMLNLKTVCAIKSKMMQGLVFDQELKALLVRDVTQSITAIEDLQALLKKTGAIKEGVENA
jgi:similar to spore coat protein